MHPNLDAYQVICQKAPRSDGDINPKLCKYMKRITLVSLVVTLFSASASADWLQWTAVSGGNGHLYEAVHVPTGIDWNSAKAEAESRGGYLATITSAAENDFVHALIANSQFWVNVGSGTRGPWLGAYQPGGSPEPGGGWIWVTGEAFTYQNWAAGEPNDGFGGESFLHYLGHGNDNYANTWNDLSSDQLLGFVVEYVPEPGTGTLLLLSLGGLALLKRKTS